MKGNIIGTVEKGKLDLWLKDYYKKLLRTV